MSRIRIKPLDDVTSYPRPQLRSFELLNLMNGILAVIYARRLGVPRFDYRLVTSDELRRLQGTRSASKPMASEEGRKKSSFPRPYC